jgi:uncharacterized repeat protein (TIGR03847 family)
VDNRLLDLGLVEQLRAESFGEPGSRTFRLLAEESNARVSLWLEKEQIVMLSRAAAELLARIPDDVGNPAETPAGHGFVGDLEVRVGSLSVGFDSGARAFSFEASDFESPFGLESIKLMANREQFTHMQEELEDIIAAGRPRCVLCGTPLSGGPHFCPPSNGHTRTN